MPRIDKYESMTGGFRAPMGFTMVAGDVEKILPVGLNASGAIVKGAGNTGVVGVICQTRILSAGDIGDVMQDGEIVDCTGLTAGTRYYGSAAGAVNTTNTDKPLGWTAEATRMIVRVAK